MKRKPTEDMTDQEFERYLKRKGIHGLAAFTASIGRKARIKRKEQNATAAQPQ